MSTSLLIQIRYFHSDANPDRSAIFLYFLNYIYGNPTCLILICNKIVNKSNLIFEFFNMFNNSYFLFQVSTVNVEWDPDADPLNIFPNLAKCGGSVQIWIRQTAHRKPQTVSADVVSRPVVSSSCLLMSAVCLLLPAVTSCSCSMFWFECQQFVCCLSTVISCCQLLL